MPIKITGVRSLKSKLERMASELEGDAERVRAYSATLSCKPSGLAVALTRTASDMRLIAHALEG